MFDLPESLRWRRRPVVDDGLARQPVTGPRGLIRSPDVPRIVLELATVALLFRGGVMQQHIGGFLVMRASLNASPHTVRAYKSDLQIFSEAMARRDPPIKEPEQVTGEAVMGWLLELRASGLRSSTVARRFAAVRAFLGWLALRGHIKHTLALPLRVRKDPPSLPRVPTVEAVQAMISACDIQHPIGARNRALLEFMYSSGCRAAEVCGLKLKDLNLERGTALVFGKGRKERLVGIGAAARRAIKLYLDVFRRPARDPRHAQVVFLTWDGRRLTTRALGKIVETCARHAHIPGIHPHTLRHAFATHMIDNGAGILDVKELLGHSSVRSTQIYTHVSVNSVLSAHRKFHPRAGDRAPAEAAPSSVGEGKSDPPEPNPAH